MQHNLSRLEKDIQTYMKLMSSENKVIFISDVVGLRHRIMRRFNHRHSNSRPLPMDAIGVIVTSNNDGSSRYNLVGDIELMGLSDTYQGRPWVAAYSMENMYGHIVGNVPLVNIKNHLGEAKPDEAPGEQLFDEVPEVPDEIPPVQPLVVDEITTNRQLVWDYHEGLLNDAADRQFPSKCIVRPPKDGDVIFPVYVSCAQNGQTVQTVLTSIDEFILLEPYGRATLTYLEYCSSTADFVTRTKGKERPAVTMFDPMQSLPALRVIEKFSLTDYDDLSFELFQGNLNGEVDIVMVPKAVMETESMTWDRLPKIDSESIPLTLNVRRLIDFEWEEGELAGPYDPTQVSTHTTWWMFALNEGKVVAKPVEISVVIDSSDKASVTVDGRAVRATQTAKLQSARFELTGKARRTSDNRRFTIERIINAPTYFKGMRPAFFDKLIKEAWYLRGSEPAKVFGSLQEVFDAGYTEDQVLTARVRLQDEADVSQLSDLEISSVELNAAETQATVHYKIVGEDKSVIGNFGVAENAVVVMRLVSDAKGNNKTHCVLLPEFFDQFVLID